MKRLQILLLILFQVSIPAFAVTWNDISRLNPEKVKAVVRVKSEGDVINTLQNLAPGNHVVVSGTRHSQGGHIVYPGAIVLDMTQFNEIVSISSESKTIAVQSGATWSQVQHAANRHGLSVKVMQSSNIFSIGGSLSANVHGRDPGYGPIIETVKSLKIALHDGRIVVSSRNSFADLFHAAIGGYGLLGVILEAEIELTENLRLNKTTIEVTAKEYSGMVENNADGMSLHYGRCSFVKDDTFLRECYSTNFYESAPARVVSNLRPEKNIRRNSLLLRASRESNLGKLARWKLQKELLDVPGEQVSTERNIAMRPPVKFLSYASPDDTDILQEYFIPVATFSDYLEQLRSELLENEVNLLSITLRYLRKNEESILSYSSRDMIAAVLYVNIGLDDESIAKARRWTRNLVDLAIHHGGTYYLTYQRFPTLEQFRDAYPKWEDFLAVKCKYDPDEVFTSKFYEQYLEAAHSKALQADNQSATRSVCH